MRQLFRSSIPLSRRYFSTSSVRALVIAQHDNKSLSDATLHSVTAAKALGGEVTVLVAGHQCDQVAQQVAKVSGVNKVLLSEHEGLSHFGAENVTSLVVDVQQKHGFSHILTAATSAGKSFLPRVGAKLDVQPISDITSVKSADTFQRPIYAGNAIQTLQSTDKVKLLTVRSTAFEKAKPATETVSVEKFAPVSSLPGLSTWVKDELSKSERPELASARVIVSGGRALGSTANFKILEALADKLGAAVGASRAAVDAGYVPNDYQIGQTGKVVAPDLYIAVGISGAIQHLAGMKDSKCIVAINKDQEAPIFQVADYGLVADLFQVVPEITKEVEKVKSTRK